MPKIRVPANLRSADKTDRKIPRDATHLRSQAASRMIKLYRTKIKRNKKGKIISGGVMSTKEADDPGRGRIAPDRRWFANSRVIDPQTLDSFRIATEEAFNDPYSFIVNAAKLPTALLSQNSAETIKKNRHRFYSTTQSLPTVATLPHHATMLASNAAKAACLPAHVPELVAPVTATPEAAAAATLLPPVIDGTNVRGNLDFAGTFGPAAKRKRPALHSILSYSALAKAAAAGTGTAGPMRQKATSQSDTFGTTSTPPRDEDHPVARPYVPPPPSSDGRGTGPTAAEAAEVKQCPRLNVFAAGQSPRIWNELYKVIDSSDVVVQVLDARDPQGTRSRHLETYLRKEKPLKKLILVLNKADLIPTWATARWIAILSREHPTLAFRSHIHRPFGKGNLISLLRQLARLRNASRTRALTVGFVGMPNVGKSSVINTLRGRKTCSAAPIPGETKVWQYVNLTRKIFLIDSPGVVHRLDDPRDETAAVLRSVVRIEKLSTDDKLAHIAKVLQLVPAATLSAHYGIPQPVAPTDSASGPLASRYGPSAPALARQLAASAASSDSPPVQYLDHYPDPTEFLQLVAAKRGRVAKGGVPDVDAAARIVLSDWQQGRLPWFVPPPFDSEEQRQRHMALPRKAHIEYLMAGAVPPPELSSPNSQSSGSSESSDDDSVSNDSQIDWEEPEIPQ